MATTNIEQPIKWLLSFMAIWLLVVALVPALIQNSTAQPLTHATVLTEADKSDFFSPGITHSPMGTISPWVGFTFSPSAVVPVNLQVLISKFCYVHFPTNVSKPYWQVNFLDAFLKHQIAINAP